MRGGGAISAPSTTDGEVAAESASAAPTPDTADAADGSAGAETENPYTTECFSEADKAKAVTSIALPATVKSIDVAFFQLFPNAAAVQVAAGNDAYQSYNGMLLNAAATDLLLVPEGMEGAAVLPSTLATVPACAFSRCTKLSAIDLSGSTEGSSFTSRNGILYKAEGDALTLLAAPAGIGASATIDAACTRIAEGAFRGNKNLKTIVAAGNVADIAEGAFAAEAIEVATVLTTERAAWEVAGFTRFVAPAEPGEMLAPAPGDSGLTYTLMENGQLSVAWTGDAPASGKRNIPSAATLHGVDYTVSVIEDGAFAGQAELTEIGIPDTIIAIGEGAFEGCTALQSVSIPGGVETVSASAFAGCESLVAATLPEGIRTIGDAAFQGTALEQLVLPASVKAVGDYAFANSPNLKTIVALGTPEQVSVTALADCAGVAVYYPYREGADHPWSLGPVTNGNHAYAYGLKPAQETYELEVGETVNIFDNGGYLVAEGDVEVTSSYKAYAISADEGGTVCAKAAGAVALSYELELDEVALDSSISAAAVKESAPLDADDEAADEEAGATEQEAMPLASSQGEYSITYQLNGGTLPEGAELVHYYNESDGEWLSEVPTREGYSLVGWRVQTTDANPYTGDSDCISKGSAVEQGSAQASDYRWRKSEGATGNVTLNAIWCKKIFLQEGKLLEENIINKGTETLTHYSYYGFSTLFRTSPTSFNIIYNNHYVCADELILKDFTPPTASNGYSFNGYWSTASGDGVQYIDRNGKLTANGAKLATQINDIPDTLYARWDPYKITLDSQGANSDKLGTTEFWVKYGMGTYTAQACTSAITQIAKPERTGYTFYGYYTKEDGKGTLIVDSNGVIQDSAKDLSEDTMLYAYWIKNTIYTVTLDAGSGSPSSEFYYWKGAGFIASKDSETLLKVGDQLLEEEEIPKWDDYHVFKGYFGAWAGDYQRLVIDAEGKIASLNFGITSDVRYWAKWEDVSIEVSLDYNDEDREPYVVKIVSGSTMPEVTVPSYEDWDFAGYANTCSTSIPQLYVHADGSPTTRTIAKATNPITRLYAIWTKEVTLSANGGNPGALAKINALRGKPLGWIMTAVDTDNPDYPLRSMFQQKITIKDWKPTREGYTFDGYYERDGSNDGNWGVQYISSDGVANNKTGDIHNTPSKLYAKWTENSVSLEYWNRTGTQKIATTTFIPNTAKQLAEAPDDAYKSTGYTALGWSTTKNQSTAKYDFGSWQTFTDTTTKKLYLAESPTEYKVTFNDNGGNAGPGTVDWAYGTYVLDHTTLIPVRFGYIFDGYYEYDGSSSGIWGEQYFSECICMDENDNIEHPGVLDGRKVWDKTDNWTLYAKWTPIKYITAFNGNGAENPDAMASQKFTYDDPQALTTNAFKRTGYTFLGWAKSQEKANNEALSDKDRIDFEDGQTVRENLTCEQGGEVVLWAAWKKNAYQVVFWANHPDDPNGSATQDMTYDVSANLRGNTFQRDRWAFDHWTTERDGGGEKYENGALVKNLTTGADVSTQTFHLYAQWTQTNFDVIYHANGGTYVEPAQVDKGAAVPNKETTREGYAFTGWFKDEACKEKWDFDADRMPNGSLDLYAGWDANEFTVTLDSGMGAGDPVSRTFVYNLKEDKKEEQHLPKFADLGFVPPTGYGFSAWALSEEPGANDQKWEDAAEVSTGLSTGDAVTLYAQYAPITYYVFFNPNPPEDSSVSGDMPDNGMQLLTYDALEALNENMFQCDGYDFDGWNTVSSPTTENPGLAIADKAGTDKALNLLDRFGVTTLYAQWKGTPYTVKFDANGGKGEMSDAAFYRGLAQELPANQFKRDGHLFAGWSTTADGSGEVFPDQAMVKNLAEKGQSEVTLYAQWNVMYNVSVPTVDHIKVLMTDDGGWITAEGAQSTITSTTPAEIGISGVRCEGAAGLADLLAAESQDKASELQLKLTANGKSALVRPGETVTDANFYFRLDEGSASAPATLPMEFELAALSPDIKLIEQTEPKDAFHLTFMLGIIQQ